MMSFINFSVRSHCNVKNNSKSKHQSITRKAVTPNCFEYLEWLYHLILVEFGRVSSFYCGRMKIKSYFLIILQIIIFSPGSNFIFSKVTTVCLSTNSWLKPLILPPQVCKPDSHATVQQSFVHPSNSSTLHCHKHIFTHTPTHTHQHAFALTFDVYCIIKASRVAKKHKKSLLLAGGEAKKRRMLYADRILSTSVRLKHHPLVTPHSTRWSGWALLGGKVATGEK